MRRKNTLDIENQFLSDRSSYRSTHIETIEEYLAARKMHNHLNNGRRFYNDDTKNVIFYFTRDSCR